MEIKCGLYARAKLEPSLISILWRKLGWGVVTMVNNHNDCEPALIVEFAGGQKHVWWASQVELSEWIDPLDCAF